MDRAATQVVQHRSPASGFNSRWVHVTHVNVLWNHMCVEGGEVQVGMCTSVMGLGKGLGGTAGNKEQVDPVEAVFGALSGHFKLSTTLEGRLGRSCPVYETVKLGLGMPVMLSSEWGVSEGRPARILSSFPLPVSGGALLTSVLSVTRLSPRILLPQEVIGGPRGRQRATLLQA